MNGGLSQVDAGTSSGIPFWVYSRGPLELRFEYVGWTSKGFPVFLVDVIRLCLPSVSHMAKGELLPLLAIVLWHVLALP